MGCGGNCACAQMANEQDTCKLPKDGITLDEHGKCPCGKSKDECCHSEAIEGNEALNELCEDHSGNHVCDSEHSTEKASV